MSLILSFIFAFLSILLVGNLAKWIAGTLSAPNASVAGFAVAIGLSIGRYSFSHRAGDSVSPQLAAGIGALVGLVVLWYFLFRRNRHLNAD